jgi:hypothetical protein
VRGTHGYLEPASILQVIVRKQMELAMSGNLQAQRAVMAMVQDIERDNETEARRAAFTARLDKKYGTDVDDLDEDDLDEDHQDVEGLDRRELESEEPDLDGQDLEARASDEPDLQVPDLSERDAEEADAAPASPPEDVAASALPQAAPSEDLTIAPPRRRRKARPSSASPSDAPPAASPGAAASRRRRRPGAVAGKTRRSCHEAHGDGTPPLRERAGAAMRFPHT